MGEIEFTPLSADETNRWLVANGSALRVSAPTSLADLYAMLDGRDDATTEATFGFAA